MSVGPWGSHAVRRCLKINLALKGRRAGPSRGILQHWAAAPGPVPASSPRLLHPGPLLTLPSLLAFRSKVTTANVIEFSLKPKHRHDPSVLSCSKKHSLPIAISCLYRIFPHYRLWSKTNTLYTNAPLRAAPGEIVSLQYRCGLSPKSTNVLYLILYFFLKRN